MSSTGEHARSVLLDIPRSLDVFTIVAQVSGGAESLSAQFPIIDARHLDAVVCLEDVLTIGQILLGHDEGWVPELGTGEVLGAVTLIALNGREDLLWKQ